MKCNHRCQIFYFKNLVNKKYNSESSLKAVSIGYGYKTDLTEFLSVFKVFMILENIIAVLRIILHCRGGSTIQQPNDSVVHVLDVVYFPSGQL